MPRKEFSRLIVWLRRDLRIEDNAALVAACAVSEEIIPLFIVDDDRLKRPDTGAARVIFLLDALNVLDKNLHLLGGRLIIRRGNAVDELLASCKEFRVQGVFFQQEYEPYGRARDTRACAQLAEAGFATQVFPGQSVIKPTSIVSKVGTPYTVYAPYMHSWFDCEVDEPLDRPEQVRVPTDVRSTSIPTPNELDVSTDQRFACGGEDAALRLLLTMTGKKLADYENKRNVISAPGTSHLSRHLHFGTISPRKVVATLDGLPGCDSFLSEIAWRDFYLQILYHFPYVEHSAFKKQYDKVVWENDDRLFRAWCDGETGYPIIDAAMRQLNSEAWMHNRARMIVASFLTKDLLINWQWGERYFMQKLVDGDLASNNGGWQWAAGTGTDAQPYFRIFNPVTQGEKFDSNGDYVRRYLPQLRSVPAKFVHSPWNMSWAEQELCGCVLGKDYPEPIVDHATQRKKSLKVYESVGI
jgi:deoxyribodipyrimidine photo-lyase